MNEHFPNTGDVYPSQTSTETTHRLDDPDPVFDSQDLSLPGPAYTQGEDGTQEFDQSQEPLEIFSPVKRVPEPAPSTEQISLWEDLVAHRFRPLTEAASALVCSYPPDVVSSGARKDKKAYLYSQISDMAEKLQWSIFITANCGSKNGTPFQAATEETFKIVKSLYDATASLRDLKRINRAVIGAGMTPVLDYIYDKDKKGVDRWFLSLVDHDSLANLTEKIRKETPTNFDHGLLSQEEVELYNRIFARSTGRDSDADHKKRALNSVAQHRRRETAARVRRPRTKGKR